MRACPHKFSFLQPRPRSKGGQGGEGEKGRVRLARGETYLRTTPPPIATPSTAAMAVTGFERKNLPWGQSRGFPTTKRELKPKPSSRKGKASKRHDFVKNVVAEVAGQAPYERRLIELLRCVCARH